MARTRMSRTLSAVLVSALVALLVGVDAAAASAATYTIQFPRAFSRSLNLWFNARDGSYPAGTDLAKWLLPESARTITLRIPAENFNLTSVQYRLYGGDSEVTGTASIRSDYTVSIPVPQGFFSRTPLETSIDGDGNPFGGPYFGLSFTGESASPVPPPGSDTGGNKLNGDL